VSARHAGCYPLVTRTPSSFRTRLDTPEISCATSRVQHRDALTIRRHYFLRIASRLRRVRSLRPRGGSGSVGAITFAFSLL
jgi:hypothetical protein